MNKQNHPLKTTAHKILEDWAMMLVDESQVGADFFKKDGPIYMSWINIHGAVEGAISIVAQQDFLQILAQNLLGLDPEDSIDIEQCKDAFKEMGNVLAGNFLTEAYGDDVVFELIHPNVTEISPSDIDKFTKRKIIFGFIADEHPVAMSFSLKG